MEVDVDVWTYCESPERCSMDDSCFVLSPVDSAFVVPGLGPKPLSDKSSNPE